MEAEVPVVDFEQLAKEEELKKLKEACEKRGYFRVVNHPIPSTLMMDMKMVAKYLHDLPMEIKKRNKPTAPDTGFRPPFPTSPLFEGFGIYDSYHSPEAIHDFCSQLNVPPQHRKIIEEYCRAVHDLASNISQKMAQCVGIVGTDFRDWPFIVRMTRYFFSQEAMGSTALQLHTDPGFFTLLQDDEFVSGLEILDDSGTFLAIPPKAGSFIGIVGNVGQAWSNGRFLNVKHRVLCKETTDRYSIGAFISSSRDGKVEAPKELVNLENAQLYGPFKFEDMRDFRNSTMKRTGEFLNQYRIKSVND